MTRPKFDIPNIKGFIRDLVSNETNEVLTSLTIVVTTDEGRYNRVVEVPGKVLSVSIVKLDTNYGTEAGKEIKF